MLHSTFFLRLSIRHTPSRILWRNHHFGHLILLEIIEIMCIYIYIYVVCHSIFKPLAGHLIPWPWLNAPRNHSVHRCRNERWKESDCLGQEANGGKGQETQGWELPTNIGSGAGPRYQHPSQFQEEQVSTASMSSSTSNSDHGGSVRCFSGENEDFKEYRRWKPWLVSKFATLDKIA